MRVKQKNGKFAAKNSALYRFVNRTGKSVDDYYNWARECGQKASHSYKDKMICEKMNVEKLEDTISLEMTEYQASMSVENMSQNILDNSENPADIASCWLELYNQNDDSIDGFLNENLRPTTKESFERWGDKNHLLSVSPSWFSKDGLPLDVQAMQLTEGYGKDINENDIISYLITYRKGKYKSFYSQLAEKYEEKFEQLFSFKLSRSYAEHLMAVVYGSKDEVVENAEAIF